MAGDKLIQTIIADAERDAAERLAQAEAQAAAIAREGARALEMQSAKLLEQAQRAADDRQRHAAAMTELDIKKARLAARRALIDEAFAEAHKQLLALDAARYQDFIVRLACEFAEGGEVIGLEPKDAALVERINAATGKAPLTYAARPGIGAGFVLVRGGMQINCSAEALLRIWRERIEGDVARALFSEA